MSETDPFLGTPVIAAATFHAVHDVPLRGGIGIGALVGLASTAAEWLIRRKHSVLPAYSYLAVTNNEIVALELSYGTTVRVRREVGRWPRAAVRMQRRSGPWSARLAIAEKEVEVEAVEHDGQARAVLDSLA